MAGEWAKLRLPHGVVEREGVDQQNYRTAAFVNVTESAGFEFNLHV
jgi:hypothetical protein